MKRETRKLEYIKSMDVDKELISYFEYYVSRSKLILALVATLNDNYQIYFQNITDLKLDNFFNKKNDSVNNFV